MSAEVRDALLDWLRRASTLDKHASRLKRIPMFGGAFGANRYELCSFVAHRHQGLDEVMFVVLEHASGAVFGASVTKSEAIAQARVTATIMNRLGVLFPQCCAQVRAERAAKAKAADDEYRAEQDAAAEARRPSAKVSCMPRRRRRLFEESDGKCFYCACDLVIDGDWHVDHKLPKALGGDNDPSNLCVACVPCNYQKRDSTDTEFIAQRGAA